jgi:hypothetical protein
LHKALPDLIEINLRRHFHRIGIQNGHDADLTTGWQLLILGEGLIFHVPIPDLQKDDTAAGLLGWDGEHNRAALAQDLLDADALGIEAVD